MVELRIEDVGISGRTGTGGWATVVMSYDPADPFAATATIYQDDDTPVPWLISRESLRDALSGHVDFGGDVTFRPCDTDWILMKLSVGEAYAVLTLPRRAVSRFVEMTRLAVEFGAEETSVADDAARYLAGEAA